MSKVINMSYNKYFNQLNNLIKKQNKNRIILSISSVSITCGILYYNREYIRQKIQNEASNTLRSEQLKKDIIELLKNSEVEKQVSEVLVKATINTINDSRVKQAILKKINPFS